MSVSYNIVLRKDRPNSKGELPIIINVTVNRKTKPYPTGERVPLDYWDEGAQLVKTRYPNAKLINSKLGKRLSEIKAAILKEELQDKVITPDLVVKKLSSGTKKDFFQYCEGLIKEWRGKDGNGKKKESTCDKYKDELSKIRAYSPNLRFSDITPEWLAKYESYQRNTLKNKDNTLWRSFKNLKTFFNEAIMRGDIKDYPFKNYDNPTYKDPKRVHLTKKELSTFIDTIKTTNLDKADISAGWFFAFSCYTGLRYSDCEKFSMDDHIIENKRILLDMTKTGGDVSLLITPALKEALSWIAPYIGKMPTNQECNRAVKAIAIKAKIKKRLTFHCARHTFGFSCAEANIPIEVTAKLMGHKDVKVTAVYYHISNANVDHWISKLHT